MSSAIARRSRDVPLENLPDGMSDIGRHVRLQVRTGVCAPSRVHSLQQEDRDEVGMRSTELLAAMGITTPELRAQEERVLADAKRNRTK